MIGLQTLYLKEVRRFLKVPGQTLAAPVVTTLMFMLIFSLALGRAGRMVGELPFLEFLAPGLVMMALIQSAFANTSSSILISKIQGNIVDLLMPPLRPGELMLGLVAGGVTRGLLVALAVALAMLPFVALVAGASAAGPLLRARRLADDGAARPARRPLGGEVRPDGGGDQLRDHAAVISVRHLLRDLPAARRRCR